MRDTPLRMPPELLHSHAQHLPPTCRVGHACRVCHVYVCIYRGGGSKRRLRQVDFRRQQEGVEGQVERLEYDPNRTAYIALVRYPPGEERSCFWRGGMLWGLAGVTAVLRLVLS